jgi:flagella basal body P-ring formation protein FlgA
MRNSLIILLMCFAFAIDPSYVKGLVKQKAQEQLTEFASFNIEIMQEPYGADKITTDVLVIDSVEVKPGITVVNVKVKIDGKPKILRYLAKVTVFDEVLVMKESAISKRVFDPSITEGRLMDVTALFDAGKKWVKSADEAKGTRYKRTVKKDSMLLEEALEKMPDILKNEVVTVKIQDGGVELICPVIALEEGYTGDTIEVINSQYKKKMQAVIKGIGTLEIKG